MHNWLRCSIAGLLVLVWNVTKSEAANLRLSCGSFEGVRAQFAANPASPPDQRGRLIKREDAISGLRLELTFSTDQSRATVTSFGNDNTTGGVQSFAVELVSGGEIISFLGVDPIDKSINLFSIVMHDQYRLIWTIHTDKIYYVDKIALGKTFIGTCNLSGL